MKLMVQTKTGWVDCLPKALFADQVVVRASGYSPYFLMYGQHPLLRTDKFFSAWNAQSTQSVPRSTWTVNRLQQLEFLGKARKSASLQLELQREARRNEHNFQVLEQGNIIKKNDFVLVRQNLLDTAFTKKLEPRWKGPYKCVE
ncbi:hypothetical protein HMI55_000657, partial [Coelomomyces lativittatus]